MPHKQLIGPDGDNVLRLDIADLSDHCPVILLQTLAVWLLRKWKLQTEQTQSRLLVKKQPDLGLHCLPFNPVLCETNPQKMLVWRPRKG